MLREENEKRNAEQIKSLKEVEDKYQDLEKELEEAHEATDAAIAKTKKVRDATTKGKGCAD